MPRSHHRDPGLEQRWRRWLQRWDRSEQSVRDFCADHRLSEASFYSWRREIARRDRATAASTPPTPPALIPVRVIAAAPIEIVLPAGTILRVPAGHDPVAVARLVAALGEPPC